MLKCYGVSLMDDMRIRHKSSNGDDRMGGAHAGGLSKRLSGRPRSGSPDGFDIPLWVGVLKMLDLLAVPIGLQQGLGGAAFVKQALEVRMSPSRIGDVGLGRFVTGPDERLELFACVGHGRALPELLAMPFYTH
jgi:hypothetical protein